MHIERLYGMLTRDNNVCKVIDLYGDKDIQKKNSDIIRVGRQKIIGFIRTLFLIRSLKYDIVHFHVSSMGKFLYVGILYILFIKAKAVRVITIHSGSFPSYVRSLGVFKKNLLKFIIFQFNSVIAVSKEIQKSLLEIHIDSKNLYIIPAFLPFLPTMNQYYENIILDAKYKNKKVVVASGYAKKIYQYETIIDAISSSCLNENVLFVLCVYNEFDEEYFSFIKDKLNSVNSYLIFENLDSASFSNILMNSDIYVRSTTHDGDCVAIREANYLGKYVIASDCVIRPEFCVLFETSNSISLATVLSEILELKECESYAMKTEKSYYEQILSVYGI